MEWKVSLWNSSKVPLQHCCTLNVPPAFCCPGFVFHLVAASQGASSLVQTTRSFLSFDAVERERELLLKLSPLDSEDMGVTHGKKVSLSIFKKCFLYLGHLSLYSSPVKVIHQKHPCGKNTFLLAWSVFERITVRVCTLINDICSVNCVFLYHIETFLWCCLLLPKDS